MTPPPRNNLWTNITAPVRAIGRFAYPERGARWSNFASNAAYDQFRLHSNVGRGITSGVGATGGGIASYLGLTRLEGFLEKRYPNLLRRINRPTREGVKIVGSAAGVVGGSRAAHEVVQGARWVITQVFRRAT